MNQIDAKIALVTNIPSPYRLPVYIAVNKKIPNLMVYFCAEREPNRKWNISLHGFKYVILNKGIIFPKKDGFNYVHLNLGIIKHLLRYNPDIVITTGYNPTHILAMLYAFVFRKHHVVMSDGWINSESHLSWAHKKIRQYTFKCSSAFIGAGLGTLELFKSYGVKSEKCFQSHLCVDNKKFQNNLLFDERVYDLMFAGNIQDVKMPMLFADIVCEVSKTFRKVKVLIIGDGPLRDSLLSRLKENKVDYEYCGYVSQELLPSYYSKAKLLLFTTKNDVWGIVCNEAFASGTPVVSTKHTAIVNDLLVNNYNGVVVDDENDIEQWSTIIQLILQNKEKWKMFSINAKSSVQRFNYENASDGICNAIKYCTRERESNEKN